jgi:hypothetical protein
MLTLLFNITQLFNTKSLSTKLTPSKYGVRVFYFRELAILIFR